MALMDFLHAELSKTFYLWGEKNTISTKHNKMRYACTSACQVSHSLYSSSQEKYMLMLLTTIDNLQYITYKKYKENVLLWDHRATLRSV